MNIDNKYQNILMPYERYKLNSRSTSHSKYGLCRNNAKMSTLKKAARIREKTIKPFTKC